MRPVLPKGEESCGDARPTKSARGPSCRASVPARLAKPFRPTKISRTRAGGATISSGRNVRFCHPERSRGVWPRSIDTLFAMPGVSTVLRFARHDKRKGRHKNQSHPAQAIPMRVDSVVSRVGSGKAEGVADGQRAKHRQAVLAVQSGQPRELPVAPAGGAGATGIRIFRPVSAPVSLVVTVSLGRAGSGRCYRCRSGRHRLPAASCGRRHR